MAVEQNGRLARSFERFPVNQRMEIGGNNLNGLKSCGPQVIGHPAGGTLDVRFVLALGANARDAQEFTQIC